MLAFGHDLHVAAFVGGVWNDDFHHDFVGRGIAYNLSYVSHTYLVQNASIDRVVFCIGMLVVMMACMMSTACRHYGISKFVGSW